VVTVTQISVKHTKYSYSDITLEWKPTEHSTRILEEIMGEQMSKNSCKLCEGGMILSPAYPIKMREVLCGNCGITEAEAKVEIQRELDASRDETPFTDAMGNIWSPISAEEMNARIQEQRNG
jgi:hypothetical protein